MARKAKRFLKGGSRHSDFTMEPRTEMKAQLTFSPVAV
jgi:hypothetical protein